MFHPKELSTLTLFYDIFWIKHLRSTARIRCLIH